MSRKSISKQKSVEYTLATGDQIRQGWYFLDILKHRVGFVKKIRGGFEVFDPQGAYRKYNSKLDSLRCKDYLPASREQVFSHLCNMLESAHLISGLLRLQERGELGKQPQSSQGAVDRYGEFSGG